MVDPINWEKKPSTGLETDPIEQELSARSPALGALFENPTHGRRAFLGVILSGAVAAALHGDAEAKAHKTPQAKALGYGISYIASRDINDVLEHMEDVEEFLGPGVAKDLKVVKYSNDYFGLIYDRDGDQESTKRIAQCHADLLKKEELGDAVVVRNDKFSPVYNISFGVGSNLEQLKVDYKVVAELLGDGIKSDLVIERTESGKYALVYKRLGDKAGADSRAPELTRHFKAHGSALSATPFPERNNQVVFGSFSAIEESDSTKPSEVRSRQPKTPAQTESQRPTVKVGPSEVEHAVERSVDADRAQGRLARGDKTAFSAFDFSTGEKLVSINEDAPMQAASMIKVFVALAFFHEVNAGRLRHDNQSKRKLQRMIQKSDNNATNWCMRKLGGPERVQQILAANYPGIINQTKIVEYIPGGGRTYSNLTSAHDCSRFLYALWNNDLPYSTEIRRLMALPGRDRIKNRAQHVPSYVKVFNKTGTTGMLCGDMGILVAKDRDGKQHAYIVVGIVQAPHPVGNYVAWKNSRGSVIGRVSSVIFDHMKDAHNLRG